MCLRRMLPAVGNLFEQIVVGRLGELPSTRHFRSGLALLAERPIQPAQPPMDVHIVRVELLSHLQFAQRIRLAIQFRVDNAQIKVIQRNRRTLFLHAL